MCYVMSIFIRTPRDCTMRSRNRDARNCFVRQLEARDQVTPFADALRRVSAYLVYFAGRGQWQRDC